MPHRAHEAQLEDEVNFCSWAAERWPRDRFTVELDPWALSPVGPGGAAQRP